MNACTYNWSYLKKKKIPAHGVIYNLCIVCQTEMKINVIQSRTVSSGPGFSLRLQLYSCFISISSCDLCDNHLKITRNMIHRLCFIQTWTGHNRMTKLQEHSIGNPSQSTSNFQQFHYFHSLYSFESHFRVKCQSIAIYSHLRLATA